MSKFPDNTLERILGERGHRVQLMWQMRGPKHTLIRWMECFLVNDGLVIVQTYDGGGWEAFTTNMRSDVESTVADVLARTSKERAELLRKMEGPV